MVVLQENIVFRCSVDEILHPTKDEEYARQDKTSELWTVFRTYIKNGNHYEPRVCAGMSMPLDIGDEVTLVGDLVDNGKYGLQFKFHGVQKQVPTQRNGIVNFFVKNVNGIGSVMAERIVDTLGLDIVSKIREDPSVLESIPGVSSKRAQNIKLQLDALEPSLDELQFFAKTNLGNARILAIKTHYASVAKEKKTPIDVVALIQKNPYQLIEDVKGIGFRVADTVALNIGFAPNDPKRIAAGVEFYLNEEVNTKGNIWVKKDLLIKNASDKKHLNVSQHETSKIIEDMIQNAILIEEDTRIYLPRYYYLEYAIANKIHEMLLYKTKELKEQELEDGIAEIEEEKNRKLDDGQKDAVKNSIKNNVSIITGGPGVGKTTTLDILLSFLETYCNMEIIMAAPTGRAAKRMTEQTGREASTIHYLKAQKSTADFVEKNGVRKVLVTDESSMIDMNTMEMILQLCDTSTKLIFVGDVDQIPSIGPGQILRDAIESNAIPTRRLTKVHRQAGDSHIITNAHLVINGKHLEKEIHKDFFISEQEDESVCLRVLVNYITKSYPKQLGVQPEDIQVLAPLKRGLLGVNNLNSVLQKALNPAMESKKEIKLDGTECDITFREGDRVIQTKNDYNVTCSNHTMGVFNGEIGVIKEISNQFGDIQVTVEFQDKTAFYDKTAISNLALAYAISIHKSQGSEFKAVILPLFNYGMPMIYNRNLLYTAITRAKSYCCIIGQRTTTNKMIHNNKVSKRQTTLAMRLSDVIK